MRAALVALLLLVPWPVEAYVSHTFQFTHVPMRVGVQHIHSPEYFLAAHSICAHVLGVESTNPPVRVGEYHVVALRLRTFFGPVEARVFSRDRNSSEFLLLDGDGGATVLGRLSISPVGVGCSVRAYADLLRPGTIGDWLLRPPQATAERVQAAMRRGYIPSEEDPNLRAYRNHVMHK
jgi:hypothetical protein